jgi:hypothetical protein
MRYVVTGLTLLLVCFCVVVSFAQTRGEGWKLYYADGSGDRYYYDKGSVESHQKGTVMVWQKATEPSTGEEVDKRTMHLQLNCRQGTYRILSDLEREGIEDKTRSLAANDKKGNPQTGELRADSKLRALFENVCPF